MNLLAFVTLFWYDIRKKLIVRHNYIRLTDIKKYTDTNVEQSWNLTCFCLSICFYKLAKQLSLVVREIWPSMTCIPDWSCQYNTYHFTLGWKGRTILWILIETGRSVGHGARHSTFRHFAPCLLFGAPHYTWNILSRTALHGPTCSIALGEYKICCWCIMKIWNSNVQRQVDIYFQMKNK